MPRATVITVSDACSRGQRPDLSGPEACRRLAAAGFEIDGPHVVPDEQPAIVEALRAAAQAACHQAHNVPDIPDKAREVKWIWKEGFTRAFPSHESEYPNEELEHRDVLVFCNHCDSPPCTRVCPTQATWKRDDGIVMMDWHRCIGCRYCVAGCPYGSRSFNWRDPRPYIQGGIQSNFPTRTIGVVEKCNFCAERLRDGLQPACVEAANQVPGGEGSMVFGNLADPGSEVNQVLSSQRTITRRVALGASKSL